ncbi:hypothetical protein DINM_003765 [Dirofilaria immitis]|nr:hypothetical protein [Dirofilaria immitis]
MLVKDVQKRAVLSEIINNSWVKAGDLGLAQILPLVGRDVLPENAHSTIIDQMVAGGVDTEENILRSLESDDFSYVTATYYLLAERVLASYREERARKAHEIERPLLDDLPADFKNNFETRETVGKSEEGNNYKSRSRSNSWRGSTSVSRRPCAILKEESEEELSTYHCGTSRQSSRHSSSSMSVFASNAGSHGRISPQDIQGLLELSRLNIAEGKRRTLSPDSRLSSRSSSPPNSSGRTSPAIGRLKVPFPGSSGLRKLGSSPHLLGICEETEECEFDKGAEQRQIITRRSISGASIMPLSASRLFVQPKTYVPEASNKSRKFGSIVAVDNHLYGFNRMLTKEDSVGSILTYSNVRMIRRRQATVSPDMAQRYEQKSPSRYHAVKPQRSTSCSSSETSDDDSERRLNFLASKYCYNYGNRRNNDDDPSKGNGGTSISSNNSGSELMTGNTINASDNASCNHDCQNSEQSSRYRNSLALKLLDITQGMHTPLHPIREMPAVLFSNSLFSRNNNKMGRFLVFGFDPNQKQAEHCIFTPLFVGEECDPLSWMNAASNCSSDGEVDSTILFSDSEKQWKQHVKRKYFLPQIEEHNDSVASSR